MTRATSSRRALLREELRTTMRQANHLVAAGVFVFAASILLGSALARPMLSLVTWATAHLAPAAIVALGPLVTDGIKGVLLLAAAFPLGRVLVPRPWPAAAGLVLVVYGLWFCFDYVIGAQMLLYTHWQPVVGRSIFLLLILWGTARLMARGRRVALEADRRGARGVSAASPLSSTTPEGSPEEARDPKDNLEQGDDLERSDKPGSKDDQESEDDLESGGDREGEDDLESEDGQESGDDLESEDGQESGDDLEGEDDREREKTPGCKPDGQGAVEGGSE